MTGCGQKLWDRCLKRRDGDAVGDGLQLDLRQLLHLFENVDASHCGPQVFHDRMWVDEQPECMAWTFLWEACVSF